jgi:hypothetical protein
VITAAIRKIGHDFSALIRYFIHANKI